MTRRPYDELNVLLRNADRMVENWAKDPDKQQMAEGGARVLGSIRRRLEKGEPDGEV